MTTEDPTPSNIEFSKESQEILRTTLLAEKTFESCALLIGEKNKSSKSDNSMSYKVELIWPCQNVWGDKTNHKNNFSNNIYLSYLHPGDKRNRFLIDPAEQILAQKWARQKNWIILGSAHSHPNSQAIPSATDLAFSEESRLMVIVDKFGTINAWWIENKEKYNQLDVAVPDQIANNMKSGMICK